MSNQFAGKTALISGGAGGIGFALAQQFGAKGMNIVIADIDANELAKAEQSLREVNVSVLACNLDVTDFEQWQQVVNQAVKHFGKLHMVVNNAGVGGMPGSLENTDHAIWRWVIDVNLMGVLYGAQAALPAIKEHGEAGWVLNVASMAGMGGVPYAGAYCATKSAVVSMSECWAAELKPFGIHVSALCPAFVKTQIHESHRNMQDQYKEDINKKALAAAVSGTDIAAGPAALVNNGIEPELLAERVVEALEQKQLYIFTHPNYEEQVSRRSAMLEKAFDNAKNSPLVKHLLGEPMPSL